MAKPNTEAAGAQAERFARWRERRKRGQAVAGVVFDKAVVGELRHLGYLPEEQAVVEAADVGAALARALGTLVPLRRSTCHASQVEAFQCHT
jgi:hypothetical protein